MAVTVIVPYSPQDMKDLFWLKLNRCADQLEREARAEAQRGAANEMRVALNEFMASYLRDLANEVQETLPTHEERPVLEEEDSFEITPEGEAALETVEGEGDAEQ